MITVQFVVGLIFLVAAITSFLFCLVMVFASETPNWLWGFIPIIIFGIIGVAMISDTPTDKDVLEGKAHYIEVYHTYGNDTIKTYNIDWNKKTITVVRGTHQ